MRNEWKILYAAYVLYIMYVLGCVLNKSSNFGALP